MKMTVSVPNELWSRVWHEGDSPSHIVQTALALLDDRAGSSGVVQKVDAALATQVEASLDRLVGEAGALDRQGYEVGVEIAARIRWSTLETLPADRQTIAELLREAILDPSSSDIPAEVVQAAEEAIESVGGEQQQLAEGAASSPTFFAGVSQALDDVRSAVRRRINSAGAERSSVQDAAS